MPPSDISTPAAHQQTYEPILFGQRILILTAHPDDEVVGFAASIARAQSQGAKIFTLYLTHGCIAEETLWPWQRQHHAFNVATRRAEAEQAADFLRVTPAGWSPRPARHLWRELPQVAEEVRHAIAARRIDELWVPAYEGGNADHDALNAVGQYFAGTLSVLEFAEYNFNDGKTCAQQFPKPNGTERTLFLTAEERAMKQQALKIYASEKQNLNYVGTDRECLRPLAHYDYTKPPHPGTLWYARFQWVPFKHPRVDFTKPQEVSAAITTFLANQPTQERRVRAG